MGATLKVKTIVAAKNRKAGLHCSFFRKEESQLFVLLKKIVKKIYKDDETVKGKSGDYLLDDSNINTENLWTLV